MKAWWSILTVLMLSLNHGHLIRGKQQRNATNSSQPADNLTQPTPWQDEDRFDRVPEKTARIIGSSDSDLPNGTYITFMVSQMSRVWFPDFQTSLLLIILDDSHEYESEYSKRHSDPNSPEFLRHTVIIQPVLTIQGTSGQRLAVEVL